MPLVPDEILRQFALGVNIDITVIERGVPANINGLITVGYVIVKPSGARVVWVPGFINDGTDGKLRYTTTTTADLDELGQYKVQIDLILPGGYDGPTEIGTFWVEANL